MERKVLEKANELYSMAYGCADVQKQLSKQFSIKKDIVVGLHGSGVLVIPEYLRDELAGVILDFLDKKRSKLEEELKAL